jgi:A/G-specific adenine glycosylase
MPNSRSSNKSSSAGGFSLPNFSLSDFVVSELRSTLLFWYLDQGRSLPWRKTRDPYAIWVSEIMLQQTQVKTVIPYFERWMKQFPSIESFANADLQTVLKAWEGLGYYARARNFHRAAQQVLQEYNGQFPTDLETVLKLSGIGRTTAGGILSAAFNQSLPILDGNVKRVLARLIALNVPPSRSMSQLWELSETLIDPENGRDFNQALMDLGATVCTPKNPACLICPWRSHCEAYNRGVQSELPMSETRAPIPHKVIGVAVIWKDQKILIDRRKAEGLLGGLWEFPGGKVEPGETIEQCIQREIKEELDIEIEVGDHLITVDHTYTHFRVSLNVHHCQHIAGEPQAIGCDEIRWVTIDELSEFPFPKANLKIIEALKQ